jgi:hypothetical protein
MGWYEIGAATVAAATVATYATLQGATTRDIEVDEVGFFCNAATASSVQICRPANTPVATGTSLLNAVNPDVAVAGVSTYASTWSTPPTTPTVIFRRITLPATIGAGYVAAWQPGFGLALSKTAGTTQWLVLWNFGAGTGSVLQAYFRAEE